MSHLENLRNNLSKQNEAVDLGNSEAVAPVIPFNPEDSLSEAQRFEEFGLTGLHRSAGTVTEEWHSELQGKGAIRVYREMMDTDPIVGAIFNAIQMLIRQVEWSPKPADDSEQAAQNAQFLDECMNDMSMTWHDTISEIMSMLGFGWAFHEIVYKRRVGSEEKDPNNRSMFSDGRIGWRKLPIRGQDTLEKWAFDENGGIRGIFQTPAPDYARRFIPIEKALLFRTSIHKNNPEGRSILRNAYRSYVFKKRFEEIEGIGIERDLAGIPIVYADPKIMRADASSSDKQILQSLKDLVINLRRDQQEGIVFPRVFDENGNLLYDIQLMGSGGARQYDTGMIIDRYDRRMAQSVLADFIMMGHETVGSFALSSSKTRLFAVALGAWLDMIVGVFNDVAIPRLFRLNGITEGIPELQHTDLEIPDLNEIADFISKLASVGIILDDDDTEDHLRRVSKLPPRPIDETRMRGEIREAREAQELEQIEVRQQQAQLSLQQQEQTLAAGNEQNGQQTGASASARPRSSNRPTDRSGNSSRSSDSR